ncbi:MAG: STAS domain-containing protein [Planctomycetota bacterium]
MSEEIPFQITRHGEVTVIEPSGTISERDRITIFSDELIKFVTDEKPLKLQVNFEYVKFFGSETLTALIRTQRRVHEYGGRMNLCGMTDDLRRIFKLCNLDGPVFHIYNSCRDAMAALED